MTFEGMGEMFEGDSADTCGGKFPLVSMGGRAEGLACADLGARTPTGASGNFLFVLSFSSSLGLWIVTCGAKKNPIMLMGGPSRGSSVRRSRSEDSHQHEWIFFVSFLFPLSSALYLLPEWVVPRSWELGTEAVRVEWSYCNLVELCFTLRWIIQSIPQ